MLLCYLDIHLVGAGDALAGEVVVGHGALVSVLLRRRVEVEPVVDVHLGAGRHAADDAHDLVVLLTELQTKVREASQSRRGPLLIYHRFHI